MKKGFKLVAVAAALLAAGSVAFAEIDLYDVQKDVALGKKTIVVPAEAQNEDLAAIKNCIEGAEGITLDLSATRITAIGDRAFSSCNVLKVIVLPKGLTSIGDYALWGCENLTQVVIPNSVTSIGDSAFGWCTSLAQVTIPSSVTSIGYAAFYACMSLMQIVIPASVTSIGVRAFSLCQGLTRIDVASGNKHYSSVDGVLFSKDKKTLVRFPPGKAIDYYEIPDGVTTIWDSAFLGCEALAQVVIPSSVTSIEDWAFTWCEKLADKDGFIIVNGILFDYTIDASRVVIPARVTKVYGSAFYLCKNLTRIDVASGSKNYVSADGVLFSKDKKTLVCFPQGKAADYYEIPEGVSAIGAWAFYGIEALRQVTIPVSVTSIGDHAFAGCKSLTRITIPSSVTSIGENAFIGIEALTQDTFADTSGWYFDKDLTKKAGADVLVSSLKDGKPLYKKTLAAEASAFAQLDLFDVQRDVALGKTTIVVPAKAQNSDLKAIVARIKEGEGITLDLSATRITTIGDMAFSFCDADALKTVILPSTLTTIGESAFGFCYSLTSITIPASVTSIGHQVFWGCTSLSKIDVASGNKSYASVDGVLFSKDKATLVYFPAGKNSEYYDVPKGTVNIEAYAFNWCTSLTSVTIPSSVTSIGERAFAVCDNLTSVTFKRTKGWYLDGGQSVGAGELSELVKDDGLYKVGAALYNKGR